MSARHLRTLRPTLSTNLTQTQEFRSWPSWAPVPNKLMVSVDVKLHSTKPHLIVRKFAVIPTPCLAGILGPFLETLLHKWMTVADFQLDKMWGIGWSRSARTSIASPSPPQLTSHNFVRPRTKGVYYQFVHRRYCCIHHHYQCRLNTASD